MKADEGCHDATVPLDRTPDALDRVRTAPRSLRHGTVTAGVQDGIVAEVDRTERIRIGKRDRGGGS
jgi:hypothetical protein